MTDKLQRLTEADKALVLSWSAFGLRAQGRLHEAIQPMKAVLENCIQQKDWKGSAINAGNLSELMLTLGNVAEAVSYGRAWLLKTVREEGRGFTRAREYLDRAVTGLREYGSYQHLPRGLFVRAECYRLMEQYANSWDDLKEAEEIAEMGGMKLHLCDYHLEAARLCAAEGKDKDAEQHFTIAKKMIEETGYLRRKNELERK